MTLKSNEYKVSVMVEGHEWGVVFPIETFTMLGGPATSWPGAGISWTATEVIVRSSQAVSHVFLGVAIVRSLTAVAGWAR